MKILNKIKELLKSAEPRGEVVCDDFAEYAVLGEPFSIAQPIYSGVEFHVKKVSVSDTTLHLGMSMQISLGIHSGGYPELLVPRLGDFKPEYFADLYAHCAANVVLKEEQEYTIVTSPGEIPSMVGMSIKLTGQLVKIVK